MSLFMVSLPRPKAPALAYLTHFCTKVHARKGEKVLVDFPLGFGASERKWIPANLVHPI